MQLATFLSLPTELHLQIGIQLDTEKDVANLAQTSRYFSRILRKEMDCRIAERDCIEQRKLSFYAASRNDCSLLKRVLENSVFNFEKTQAEVDEEEFDGSSGQYWHDRWESELISGVILPKPDNYEAPAANDSPGWPEAYKVTEMDLAVIHGNLVMVELLVNYDAPINIAEINAPSPVGGRGQRRTSLYLAVLYRYFYVAKRLLELGANASMKCFEDEHDDPNWIEPVHGGRAPLSVAIESGDRNMVKLLLDHGADANVESIGPDWRSFTRPSQSSLLMQAVDRCDDEILDLMLSRCNPPTEEEKAKLLHSAVESGNLKACKLFMTPQNINTSEYLDASSELGLAC